MYTPTTPNKQATEDKYSDLKFGENENGAARQVNLKN